MGSEIQPLSLARNGELIIRVRVVPRASRSEVAGVRADRVLVRLHAAPVDGAANDELAQAFGKDFVRPVKMNVTSEDAVIGGFANTAVEFGGIDILVSNAGLASSAPIEETTLELWNKNMDILSTGYFLVSREAFRMFRAQKIGGTGSVQVRPRLSTRASRRAISRDNGPGTGPATCGRSVSAEVTRRV